MSLVIRKFMRALLSVWFVVTAMFFLMRLAGDPALEILGGDEFSAEVLASFRSLWGIDAPLWQQYLSYLAHIADGDFGRSFLDQRPAWDVVFDRLPKTLLLMMSSLVVALGIGVPAGIIAALNHNRAADTLVTASAIALHALPNFVLGILLMLVFAVKLHLLPAAGSGSWRHVILPAFTFGATGAAVYARFVRSAMLETLRQPYIVAARSRGLPRSIIVLRHALPNAALPILTILGFSAGALVAGSIVVETIFAWPGVGRLTATAVGLRDLPVVQVIVLLVMVAMVATNLVIDMLYVVFDPRIRVRGERP